MNVKHTDWECANTETDERIFEVIHSKKSSGVVSFETESGDLSLTFTKADTIGMVEGDWPYETFRMVIDRIALWRTCRRMPTGTNIVGVDFEPTQFQLETKPKKKRRRR